MKNVFIYSGIFLSLLMLLSLYRAVVGPTVLDRLLGVNAIGSKTTTLLILIGLIYQRVDMFVDIALAYAGDAREESYYGAFEGLLKEWATSSGKKNIHITTLPKQTEAGNPDFRVWDGKQHIVGYIEAKAPITEDLRAIEDSEQLRRYRNTFPNLILTNFFEFRLYRNGVV